MTVKYKCSECQSEFTDHEAYCENWQEPDKKFGCPNCKTMFRKTSVFPRQNWATAVYFGGVCIPVLFHGPEVVRNGDVATLILLGSLLLSSTILLILYLASAPKNYVPIEPVRS